MPGTGSPKFLITPFGSTDLSYSLVQAIHSLLWETLRNSIKLLRDKEFTVGQHIRALLVCWKFVCGRSPSKSCFAFVLAWPFLSILKDYRKASCSLHFIASCLFQIQVALSRLSQLKETRWYSATWCRYYKS